METIRKTLREVVRNYTTVSKLCPSETRLDTVAFDRQKVKIFLLHAYFKRYENFIHHIRSLEDRLSLNTPKIEIQRFLLHFKLRGNGN
ncbi:hypothetical protein CEXT_786541 [Caerostris extrusa]|uniref:Ribosomal protein S10 n=1 Tax=Caerostris extrusa TaxID=172846 RepID=A0AAV4YBD1_CAEEX|nr:hypothetical protein CEXT_786541 [Caerostris extrusa]